jgi:8-oxo-dGTP pyrophosphatase MutT (NUDIX family)
MVGHVACRPGVEKARALQNTTAADGFLRHVHACHNVRLPGRRLPFRIGTAQVGWVLPELAAALAGFAEIRADPGGVTLTDPARLQPIARALAERGFHRWRNEAFDVRAEPDGPVLAVVDRGALPSFGVRAIGVHVNGLVRRDDGLHLWVGRRAANKHLDPGKLDHLAAGGVPSGLTPWETLLKEAEEEAAIPPDLAEKATLVGHIAYAMERTEGLRRDLLHCYDLYLPPGFVPHPSDGEVAAFELWPLPRVLETVRDTDAFKFNVNLVLIDLFLRLRLISGPEARKLRDAVDAGERA